MSGRNQKQCPVPMANIEKLAGIMRYKIIMTDRGNYRCSTPILETYLKTEWLSLMGSELEEVVISELGDAIKKGLDEGYIYWPVKGDRCDAYANGIDRKKLRELAAGIYRSLDDNRFFDPDAVQSMIFQHAILELLGNPPEVLRAMDGRVPSVRREGWIPEDPSPRKQEIPATPNDTRAKTLESMRGSIDEMEASLARMKAAYNELAGLDR